MVIGNQNLQIENFLEIFELIVKHDHFVWKRVAVVKNTQFTSPMIQNEIIDSMGNIVQAKFVQMSISCYCMCSILAGETKDCSKVEQCNILRYVDLESATAHKRFRMYVEAKC